MQIYDFTLAPNKTQEIASEGGYVYYYNGSAGGADATISLVHDTTGTRIVLLPGQAFRISNRDRKAGRWLLSNYANAGTITGRVVVGDGEITDNRITGSVNVINGELDRTDAVAAFYGSTSAAGVAGQYSILQLWNPVGNTKDLVLTSISGYSTIGTAVQVRNSTAAMASLDLSYPNGIAKKGAGSSVAEIRYTNNAAIQGNRLLHWFFPANSPQQIRFNEPVVIQPGNGILLHATTVNTDLQGSFEYWQR